MNSHLAAPAPEEETPRAQSPKRLADGTLKGPPDAFADQAKREQPAQRCAALRCAALRSLACCTALHAHRATHPRACAATRRYAKTRDPNPGPLARKQQPAPLDHNM